MTDGIDMEHNLLSKCSWTEEAYFLWLQLANGWVVQMVAESVAQMVAQMVAGSAVKLAGEWVVQLVEL